MQGAARKSRRENASPTEAGTGRISVACNGSFWWPGSCHIRVRKWRRWFPHEPWHALEAAALASSRTSRSSARARLAASTAVCASAIMLSKCPRPCYPLTLSSRVLLEPAGSNLRSHMLGVRPHVLMMPCRYALKELDMKPMQRKEREDCLNEVRILASSIDSSCIVRYFDAFMQGDSLWIVTELARGGDVQAKLKRHLKREEPMSEGLIWTFFIQICQGLKELHAAKILHRDIKAPNIFITGPRSVKIGDLGVAKCTKNGMAQTQIGTPYYMSPEVWRNQKYDRRSDIWSLGVLLYELAALKHPFQAHNEKALCDKVLRGQYPPLPKNFSSDLSTVIKMLLQLDPNKRPSATEILDHPIVRARMQANPDAIQATAPLERDALIPVGTIQLPRSLVDLQRRLPGAKYSIVKPSDPNKNESGKPDPTPEPKTRRSSHSDEECKDTRHKRRDMLVAQSMDEGILARSKSQNAKGRLPPLNQARELPQPSRSKAGGRYAAVYSGRAEMAGATGAKPRNLALHSELAQAKGRAMHHEAPLEAPNSNVIEQTYNELYREYSNNVRRLPSRQQRARQSQLALVQFHQRRRPW